MHRVEIGPDQRLTRRQRADHLLALRLVADRRDEILDDRQCNVCFEQCEAHFAQRVLDVCIRQSGFAAKRLDDARQPFGKVIEHVQQLCTSRKTVALKRYVYTSKKTRCRRKTDRVAMKR